MLTCLYVIAINLKGELVKFKTSRKKSLCLNLMLCGKFIIVIITIIIATITRVVNKIITTDIELDCLYK